MPDDKRAEPAADGDRRRRERLAKTELEQVDDLELLEDESQDVRGGRIPTMFADFGNT
ncbi:MAG: hypothetical protein ACYDHH_16550 [Solirubrobacteraceae bacterium]